MMNSTGHHTGRNKIVSDILRVLVMIALWSAPCSCGSRFATFYRKTYMDDHIIYTPLGNLEDTLVGQQTNVTSVAQCSLACLNTESCGSFFLDDAEDLCWLHSILFLGADEAVAKPGTTYWQLTQKECDSSEGFILYRPLGLCYKYHSQTVFWDDAETACNNAGTSLLKVDSEETFQHMYQFLRGSTATRLQHVSIGASEKVGSTYRWRDGSDVTWFNWASGEPSASSEQCVTMAWFYFFQWNDVPCTANPAAQYNFICQKTI